MAAERYGIGSDTLPGLSKITEECGEVLAVCGKIMGLGSDGYHWDGTNLRARAIEEFGDVVGAIRFFTEANFTDDEVGEMLERASMKTKLFWKWHREQK